MVLRSRTTYNTKNLRRCYDSKPILAMLQLLLLSSLVHNVDAKMNLDVESYECDGDFLSIDDLELSCPSDTGCGLGKDVTLTGTLADTSSQLPNYVNLDVTVSIENYMSVRLYSGTSISLCDYVTPTDIDEYGSSSYTCPSAGEYIFEIPYTIPSDTSTLWLSSGQDLNIEFYLQSMAGTSTTCELVLDPSSIYAAMYYAFGVAGLAFVAIAGYVGSKRRCIQTCNAECVDSGSNSNNVDAAYFHSDDSVHHDYYRSSDRMNLEMSNGPRQALV